MMHKNFILLPSCMAASTVNTAAIFPAKIKMGEPHSTVQTLNAETFRPALNDPANGLWLLKFYAPWSGHCKHLAPRLDAMAPHLSGKIAIGKVDCTSPDAKEICVEFEIPGYPTIKVYHDGDFFDYSDYSWKKDADSLIRFTEQMSKPAVKIVETYDAFMVEVLKGKEEEDKAEESLMPNSCDPLKSLMPTPCGIPQSGSSTGVAFLVFDAKGKEMDEDMTHNTEQSSAELTTVEKYMTSTTALQVFGQASRKLQHRAAFGMLHPSKERELNKFGIALTDMGEGHENHSGPLLVKIEENVDAVIYDGPLTTMDIMDFVKTNNMALVTDLSGRNFRNVAFLGKELFIGVVNPDNDAEVNDVFLSSMRSMAKAHDEYVFCQMDGKNWANFLSQFNIETNAMPQFLVLDVPTRKYFQDETITDIREFVERVKDGIIAEETCEELKLKGFPNIRANRDGDFFGAGILKSFYWFMSRNLLYIWLGAVVCTLYQSEILKLQLERAKKEFMKKKAKKDD